MTSSTASISTPRRPGRVLHFRPARPLYLLARGWSPLLALACLSLTTPAYSVGLGEAQTNSHIGQLLQVRVPLQGTSDDALSTECIRLEGPRASSADDLPWLRNGRLQLMAQDGQQILVVNSTQPINSPVIMLAVRLDCGTSLRREYTLLLNPPGSTDVAPAIIKATPNPAAKATPDTSAPASTLRTRAGESLRSIAQSFFPDNKSLQRDYANLIRAQNADKLGNTKDSAQLPAGLELQLPDMQALDNKRLPSAAEHPAAPVRKAAASQAATPAPARSKRSSEPQQRLIVGSAALPTLQMETTLAGRKDLSEKERAQLRTDLQLIATLDDKIATQLELSEKLRQLEALQTQMQSAVQALEQRIQTQQAVLANGAPAGNSSNSATPASLPSKAQVESALSFSALPWWLWPAALLLVLLILVLALLRQRRARSAEKTLILDEAGPTQSATAADNLYEPLTEEDIWPEHKPSSSPEQRPAASDDLPSLSEIGPTSVLHIGEDLEEHNSAVELAEIMMSFGRVQGAAQTLADFIRNNPKQAVRPWVKLLEVYKAAEMRTEFEALTAQLNKTFNVKPVAWEEFEVAMQAPESIENIAHLNTRLCAQWGTRECQAWLYELLRDNRQGSRQGFPLAIVDEILLLMGILEAQLGPYKPDTDGANLGKAAAPANASSHASANTVAPTLKMPTEQLLTPTLPAAAGAVAALSATAAALESGLEPAKPTEELLDLNFDMGSTDLDLGLDMDSSDLSTTLTINLDDLPDDDDDQTHARTRFEPRDKNL